MAFFAELASALIHTLLSETSSLMQEAVNTTFPRTGEKPLQLAGPKGLTAHVRRQKAHGTSDAKKAEKPSFLQREASASNKPSNDVDSGIVGFGTTEAQPYASMLITQFGGDEFDSGSCLAFAPSHRSGRAGNVTKRDWQVPSPDSADFVKLEPWAVPCDNQWAKDNPSKWEGYSFYTYESVIEKCAAITYSMSAQPVISFVGGLEFDILPAPLIEITTEVCWPDRVTAPDLSLMVFTARSAGIVPRWCFQNVFIFTPIPGEMIQFDEHIFQMGWFNHQLGSLHPHHSASQTLWRKHGLHHRQLQGFHRAAQELFRQR